MYDFFRKEKTAQITVALFLLFNIWWIILRLTTDTTSVQNQIFGASYGIVALLGGIWGVFIAQRWGGFKSVFGRALMMFALGLLAQEFGQIIYSFYTFFLHIEIPYPSLGDVGYFGSIPLYIYGTILLAKVSGVHVGLKSFKNQLQAVVTPLIILTISYWVFLRGHPIDLSQPLTTFLDFGYPLGQAIYISIAMLTYFLSRNILGGVMKSRVLFLLFALVAQYISDYTFLYRASRGLVYSGGPVDFLYLVSYVLMALALLQLNTALKKIRHSN